MAEKLILREISVGPWPMNTYVLICPQTGESVLFDPGADPDKLQAALADSTPTAIWLTHTHPDHVGALSDMRQQLGVPVLAHAGQHSIDPKADGWLKDGDVVSVGNYQARIYYTPGHIGDQICYVLVDDNRAIVGDTIFEGGPGKTWSVEGFQTTLSTLKTVVLAWPDETICYPGHGPHFVLGGKRAAIETFVSKTHPPDFFGDAAWEM